MSKRNVVHIEIPAGNFEAAGRFYQELFGWKITLMPEVNYAVWEAGEGPGGGFNPLSKHIKPGDVLIYIDSDDIEADLKKVETFGGKVLQPKTKISQGWFGMFQDPTGNTLALYTNTNPTST